MIILYERTQLFPCSQKVTDILRLTYNVKIPLTEVNTSDKNLYLALGLLDDFKVYSFNII